MSKAKIKQGLKHPYAPAYLQQEIPQVRIKPKNWIAKILWRWIKLDVKIVMIKNPIIGAVNKETKLCDLIPRVKMPKAAAEIRDIP